jgi:hypothetical protein
MDPQACLNELIRLALCTSWDDDVNELAVALVDWHAKGGFLPDLKVALDAAIERRREMIGE